MAKWLCGIWQVRFILDNDTVCFSAPEIEPTNWHCIFLLCLWRWIETRRVGHATSIANAIIGAASRRPFGSHPSTWFVWNRHPYLRRLIQRFHHVYIVLDALDESPRLGARGHVLDTIKVMQNWSLPGLHLLVTSRDEPDIRNSLDLSLKQEVKMRNAGIDTDIADFISSQLHENQSLWKWLPYSDRIQEKLSERAKGV